MADIFINDHTVPPPGPDDPLNRPIWIEGGTFSMGSDDGQRNEKPVRRVTVSAFWIQEHPVTNDEYQRFDPDHDFPSGQERYPVVHVNWQQAVDYAASVGGSLPTEAEWEFAARGAEGREYPWGDAKPTCERAHYFGCDPSGTIRVMSRPVGATPEGVHDLAGNVREWVADWYGPYDPSDLDDPTGPASGTSRVLRGGSWGLGPGFLRGAYRSGFDPDSEGGGLGFRVVWALAGGQEN